MASTIDVPLSRGSHAAIAALFLFFWASGFVAAKYGFPYAEPFTFLTLRFAIASASLLVICALWRAPWPRTPRQFAHVAIAGVGVQSVYLIGVYYGIFVGVSTGVIALIVGLQPLLTGALAGRMLGETIGRRQWLGLVLGFAGLAMVVWDRITGGGALWGFAFGALGLAGITLGTLYQKKYVEDTDLRSAVTIQNLVSLVLFLILAGAFETMRVEWTGAFLFALLWSAFGLSVIAISLYYLLVRRGAASRVTSLIYLSPPTTALMGFAAFDEHLGAAALCGMAVAISGVWLASRG